MWKSEFQIIDQDAEQLFQVNGLDEALDEAIVGETEITVIMSMEEMSDVMAKAHALLAETRQ